MTDEEKTEEYVDNLDLVKERNPELKTNYDFIKQAYLDGLTEGRIELENKLKQFEEGEIVCIKHYEAIRGFPVLKEQVEDWKADHEHNLELMKGLNGKIAELNKQIEKMKCCTTCVNHTFYIPQVDRLVKGKNDTKCENCIHYSLNKLENYRKGKELVDNWELAE